MAHPPSISFGSMDLPGSGTLVLFAGKDMALGEAARRVDEASEGLITDAAKAQGFKAKRFSAMTLPLPRGLEARAVVVIGLGDGEFGEAERVRLGGAVLGALPGGPDKSVTVFADAPDGPMDPAAVADLALGAMLRAYTFNKYKTKADDAVNEPYGLTFGTSDPAAAGVAFAPRQAVAQGTVIARDLVNEPANILGPVEFATEAEKLSSLGVKVTVLDVPALEALKMRALLGVAQGSARPARVAIMEWNGGAEAEAPVALVGKGVVFDTGGISIKPAAGMEDMKGDMGGAAAVVGTLHAVAARKAKANVVGVIGLVENMPDGHAQRPGDIVTAMSGQTIEIINTDAEGRLVLADLLTHTIGTFKPAVVIDLATLTGAIIVALGYHHAGMYTDDDAAAAALTAAGLSTGDHVWRMPLGKAYDTLIDSKFADMKNTGGRWAGSITAAQFLKRFAEDACWVHLDVAGTAMNAPTNEISRTFGSGFGVRLLDRYIADNFEKGAS